MGRQRRSVKKPRRIMEVNKVCRFDEKRGIWFAGREQCQTLLAAGDLVS
jgi:hypothetical protein